MWAAIIGAVVSFAGASMGAKSAEEQRKVVLDLLKKTQEEYGKLSLPALKEIIAEQLGPSALEDIEQNAELGAMEREGLDVLQQMQDMGGLTLQDQQALNKIANTVSRQESAGRNAIANEFAARGQLGSNAQLAMSLQNQQGAANRAAEAGEDTAANAQRRYFEAVLAKSKMAGDLEEKDYARQAEKARAADMIRQNNLNYRRDASSANNAVAQQQFGNNVTLAAGRAGQTTQMANYLGNQADRDQERAARTADAAGKLIVSVADDDDEDGKK